MLGGSLRGRFSVLLVSILSLVCGQNGSLSYSGKDCLAPNTAVDSLSKKESRRHAQLAQTVELLRIVQAHCEILGDSVMGKEAVVAQDLYDAEVHPNWVSQGETTLSPSLSFLYTFQSGGLQKAAARAQQWLEKGIPPDDETLSLSFFPGSGIQLRRWLRLFAPDRHPGLLKSLKLAPHDFGDTPHRQPRRFVVAPKKGKEAFVLRGAAAEEWGRWVFDAAPEALPEELKSFLSLEKVSGQAVEWSRDGKITSLNLVELDRPMQPHQVCVVGMELDFHRLVEMLGEKNLARQSLFHVVSQLQDAFSQERNHPYLQHGEEPVECVWVGKEEAEKSRLLKHYPASLFQEPLILSRLIRLLSYSAARLPAVIRYGAKGVSSLPFYEEEVRDEILIALSRHNPKWFDQSLQFLLQPVNDRLLGEPLDRFEEEAAFLSASGWIDAVTHQRLIQEHAGGKSDLAQKVVDSLLDFHPFLSQPIPEAELYAQLKRRAFFGTPLSNPVARYVRRLKAEEFARRNDWLRALPEHVFAHDLRRLARALLDDYAAHRFRAFYAVSHLVSLGLYQKDFAFLSYPAAQEGKKILLWLSETLKGLFTSPEESLQFWRDFVSQAKNPNLAAGFSFFAHNMLDAVALFAEELELPSPRPVSEQEHPFSHIAAAKQWKSEALAWLSTEESL